MWHLSAKIEKNPNQKLRIQLASKKTGNEIW
jgi:hypothetical protein